MPSAYQSDIKIQDFSLNVLSRKVNTNTFVVYLSPLTKKLIHGRTSFPHHLIKKPGATHTQKILSRERKCKCNIELEWYSVYYFISLRSTNSPKFFMVSKQNIITIACRVKGHHKALFHDPPGHDLEIAKLSQVK